MARTSGRASWRPRPRRFRFCSALSLILVALGGEACAPARAARQDELAAARLGSGWVVWESNRSGAFRIWIRPLAGGAPRQLSADEPGRDHCCPHLSPDGDWVAYLSLPGRVRKYTPPTTVGALHLVATDGRRDHVIAAARHYGEHRAVLWWSDDELAFIDEAGDSRLLDLSLRATRLLSRGPAQGEGYLIDPSGHWATSSTARFSPRDPATGEVRPAALLGGCQAWIAPDGQVGVWMAGAGGPINAIELATRRSWTVLAKHDPRLPRARGYLYFPMLSRDRTLLAVAASDDRHDHFRADYDVFLVPLDPASLAPTGDAVRVTDDPAVDRYPDVWRVGMTAPQPVTPPAPAAPTLVARGWPANRDGLVFLWEAADRPNQIAEGAASETLSEHGEAWSDRRGRLALAGGSAEADPASAARVAAALRGANAVTVELVVEPHSLASRAGGTILALGGGVRQRGLWLGQAGADIGLRVRTGMTGPSGGQPATLARLSDASPHHLAFSYSPGRLHTYLDGVETGAPRWIGDFFPWRVRTLTLGAEPGTAGAFRGALSHLAIFARELPAAEIAADARRVRAELDAAPAVTVVEVEATLVERSRPPALAEISPYRRALVTEIWRPLGAPPAPLVAGPLRVVRWALLDGRPATAALLAPGARARLRLEPFGAQTQLESVVLADTLPPERGAVLWFDAGLGEER
jgi:hypothetical protein